MMNVFYANIYRVFSIFVLYLVIICYTFLKALRFYIHHRYHYAKYRTLYIRFYTVSYYLSTLNRRKIYYLNINGHNKNEFTNWTVAVIFIGCLVWYLLVIYAISAIISNQMYLFIFFLDQTRVKYLLVRLRYNY